MFSFISMNWKGRPLENYESVVRLIASTTTKNGLNIKARLDRKQYKTGMKVSDEEFDNINLKFAKKVSSMELHHSPYMKFKDVQLIL